MAAILYETLRSCQYESYRRLGPSLDNIRKEIEGQTTFREKVPTSVEIPFSGEVKRVLQFTAEEADRLRHNHIVTEHLLLGILREERSVAAAILMRKGMRLHSVRDDIVQLLNEIGHEFAGPALGEPPAPRARSPIDEQLSTKLTLARLFKVAPHRIDAPAQLEIPLTITRELRTVDAYVLTRVQDRTPPLHTEPEMSGGGVGFGSIGVSVAAGAPEMPSGQPSAEMGSIGPLSLPAATMGELAQMLEHVLETPISDETELEGRYTIELPGSRGVEAFLAALKEHAGLALTREKRDVEMVVVRRV